MHALRYPFIWYVLLLLCLGGCSNTGTPSDPLTSPADLKDKRIAVLQGSTHESYATEHYPRATVLQYKSVSDMMLALKSGKADAAIYTRKELAVALKKNIATPPAPAAR